MRLVDSLNSALGSQFDVTPESTLQYALRDLLSPGSLINLMPPGDVSLPSPGIELIVTYDSPVPIGSSDVWNAPSKVTIDNWNSAYLAQLVTYPKSVKIGILTWAFNSAVNSIVTVTYVDGRPLFPDNIRNLSGGTGDSRQGSMFVDLDDTVDLLISSNAVSGMRFRLYAVTTFQ